MAIRMIRLDMTDLRDDNPENLLIDEMNIYKHFNSRYISTSDIHRADIIIFEHYDGKIVELKNRYNEPALDVMRKMIMKHV